VSRDDLGELVLTQQRHIAEKRPPWLFLKTRRESSEKIEQIRKDYKDQFGQASVLRSDFCCERVGF
jgi:hypothetical protein